MDNRFHKLILIATITTMTLFGQGRPPGGFGGDPSQRLNFLAGYLGLSDSQKQQVEAIYAPVNTAVETLRGQMQSKRAELNTAVKANSSAAALNLIANAIGDIEGQIVGLEAGARARVYQLLTAEQRAKLDSMEAMRPGRP